MGKCLKSKKRMQNYIYMIELQLCFGGSKLKEKIQILNGCSEKVECRVDFFPSFKYFCFNIKNNIQAKFVLDYWHIVSNELNLVTFLITVSVGC